MAGENWGLRRRLRRAIANLTGDTPQSQQPGTRRSPARVPDVHLTLYPQGPQPYPDRASLAATADAQQGSALLTALPAEIRRLVYGFMWRTGGHLHGIHFWYDSSAGFNRSGPCGLGHGVGTWGAAGVNALLDAVCAERGLDEAGRLRGVELPEEYVEALADRVARNHWECDDDRVDGARNAARFRTGKGVDPLALWWPFLPVLLTCKRV